MALVAAAPYTNNYSRTDGGTFTTFPTGDFTIGMWVKRTGSYSARTTMFQLDVNLDFVLGTTAAGVLSLNVNAGVVVSGGTVTADVWKFIALTHSGTTFELWLGDLTTSATSQGSATNATNSAGSYLQIFSDQWLASTWDGAIAFPRVWNVALTSGELNTERTSTTLVKTANRWADWNFSAPTATIIDSGFSTRTITKTGAISRTEDPFIAAVTSATINTSTFPKPTMRQPLLSGRLL